MQHSMVQALFALSVAFLILALGDRKRSAPFSAAALLFSTTLYFFNARFLGWGVLVACLPIFVVAFMVFAISNAAHMMPSRDRQWVEGLLARASMRG
ncbi:hypothetical protein EON81_29185 [bacterium]|nr:MAG: hypothetical protein EON81_29185 [bacterium]